MDAGDSGREMEMGGGGGRSAAGGAFRPDAPVVIRAERAVGASRQRVWEILTAVERWPSWHRGIRFAALRGPVEPGTLLQWRADGMRLTSVLGEVEEGTCLGWTIRTLGARGYQRWTLEAGTSGGTHVRLEESWDGLAVRLFRGTLRRTLQRSREEWLDGLGRVVLPSRDGP